MRYPLGKKKNTLPFAQVHLQPQRPSTPWKVRVLMVWLLSWTEKARGCASRNPVPAKSICTCRHPQRPRLDRIQGRRGVFHTGQIIPAEKNLCLYRRQRGHFRNFPEKSLQPLWSSPSVPNLWPKPLMLQTKPLLFALSSHRSPFFYERRRLLYLMKWPCTHVLAECHQNPVTSFIVLSLSFHVFWVQSHWDMVV